ncbi:hypothetical protein QTN24_15390 [Cupriavidus sp. SZY C1]|uniref:DUF551 domain-containing protein n=1 Tax=Cupriavidus sp. SZY C1 TaxID=3055037 RepID=UPI0028B5D767|nr:DUF551 domain-containing protein [Cupriavidus sp. SZY C1]MDT6962883.1 hypothetical protein [Cupriavidus sp. SZY C1]
MNEEFEKWMVEQWQNNADISPLAAWQASRKQAGWQPIATAPKDGTNIIVTNGSSVAQGWWCSEEPYVREQRDLTGAWIDQQESDGFEGWLDCDGGMQPDPTHWMPLPQPPAMQKD